MFFDCRSRIYIVDEEPIHGLSQLQSSDSFKPNFGHLLDRPSDPLLLSLLADEAKHSDTQHISIFNDEPCLRPRLRRFLCRERRLVFPLPLRKDVRCAQHEGVTLFALDLSMRDPVSGERKVERVVGGGEVGQASIGLQRIFASGVSS